MMKIATRSLFILFAWLTIILLSGGCKDEQNAWVPYVKVNRYISLPNNNSLYIPGNSLNLAADGFGGLIVICINESQYYAFDACCPYEGERTCRVSPEPGRGGDFASSNPIATCPCCGSTYNLFGGGYPTKGPSSRNLKMYQATVVSGRIWIHN